MARPRMARPRMASLKHVSACLVPFRTPVPFPSPRQPTPAHAAVPMPRHRCLRTLLPPPMSLPASHAAPCLPYRSPPRRRGPRDGCGWGVRVRAHLRASPLAVLDPRLRGDDWYRREGGWNGTTRGQRRGDNEGTTRGRRQVVAEVVAQGEGGREWRSRATPRTARPGSTPPRTPTRTPRRPGLHATPDSTPSSLRVRQRLNPTRP